MLRTVTYNLLYKPNFPLSCKIQFLSNGSDFIIKTIPHKNHRVKPTIDNNDGFLSLDIHFLNCIYRASRPSQTTVNEGAVSKWPRCRWDVKHNQPNQTFELFLFSEDRYD